MKYAVIDLETTGSKPMKDRIIEIAIVIYEDGVIKDTYESLINPERYIGDFISKFTGISNEMVRNAPKFYEIAKDVIEWTEDCVFVAHNVSFDYSFLKLAFKSLGFDYRRKTLCTVRLSRKIIKGQKSYSLGKLCRSLKIPLKNRHRAGGDATATAKLLKLLCELDQERIDKSIVDDEVRQMTLPPKISHEQIVALPEKAGVYYFLNEAGEIIYVGKSIHIRTRVISHFQTYHKSRKQGQIKKQISKIEYTLTGNELIALLFESDEIKKIKPKYNRAQRRSIFPYGVFYYKDPKGYIRFIAKKINPSEMPVFFADTFQNARKILLSFLDRHQLCSKLCNIYAHSGACFDYHIKKCKGACIEEESPEEYNERALKVISHMSTYVKPDFMIIGEGREATEKSIVCVQNGKYMGFGYLSEAVLKKKDITKVMPHITTYEDNKDTQRIIRKHLKDTDEEIWYF